MKRRRKSKLMVIASLVVAVIVMSIGFAVFSSTLLITSTATVKPDSSSFGVKLYAGTSTTDTSTTVTGSTNTSATVGTATINEDRNTITGVSAGFTAPGQSVVYTFYAHNIGEYEAYLRSILYDNVSGQSVPKVCSATSSDTTTSLVEDACEYITLTVNIGSASTTDSLSSISGHKLDKSAYEAVYVTISYASNGARADGEFNVSFGDVTVEYSSVDATS